MYKGKKILSLIPARGGSKGLPHKNILRLNGKPLITWTIEQSLASKYCDRTVVSTNDKKIANISRHYGAEVPFLRPEELATDKSPTIDTILHALDYFEEKGEYFDILVLLEPTSPLRKKNDIDKAIKLYVDNANKASALISVGEIHMESPYATKVIKKGYVLPLLKINYRIHQRQQLSKTYFPYGVIYLSDVKSLKKYKTFYQKKTIPYLIERWQNYEVDDIYDFVAIEAIMKKERKKLI